MAMAASLVAVRGGRQSSSAKSAVVRQNGRAQAKGSQKKCDLSVVSVSVWALAKPGRKGVVLNNTQKVEALFSALTQ